MDPIKRLKVIVPFFSVTCSFLIAPVVGQDILNTWEKLRVDLYSCPWMTWSKKNNNLLKLTLLNLLKAPSLNTYGLLEYDFPLILKAVRLSYGLLTFLVQVKN